MNQRRRNNQLLLQLFVISSEKNFNVKIFKLRKEGFSICGFSTMSFSVVQLWQADGWQRQETQRMLRPRALRDDRGE